MTASPEQLHAALTYCVDFAKTMLLDSGAFHPFGAFVDSAGKVVAVGAWTGEEQPKGSDVHEMLVMNLRVRVLDGSARAIAVAADVNIPAQYNAPQKDGLRVTLEAHGYSRFIYVPYQIKRGGVFGAKKSVEFSEPFSVELEPPS
jgi:hypothetical protein